MMKQIFAGIALLLVAMVSMPVTAEVFKWVDDKGQVHFGDQVPEQYQGQTQTVELQPNVIESNRATTPDTHPASTPPVGQVPPRVASKPAKTSTNPDDSCAAQWARFEASRACFNSCYQHTPTLRNGAHNASECRCADTKAPECKPINSHYGEVPRGTSASPPVIRADELGKRRVSNGH